MKPASNPLQLVRVRAGRQADATYIPTDSKGLRPLRDSNRQRGFCPAHKKWEAHHAEEPMHRIQPTTAQAKHPKPKRKGIGLYEQNNYVRRGVLRHGTNRCNVLPSYRFLHISM